MLSTYLCGYTYLYIYRYTHNTFYLKYLIMCIYIYLVEKISIIYISIYIPKPYNNYKVFLKTNRGFVKGNMVLLKETR